jgi:undecaprenyl-diphosphatase
MMRFRTYPKRLRARQRRALWWLAALFPCFLTLSLLIHSPMLLAFDLGFTTWLQRFRHDWLDSAAQLVTTLGNTLHLMVFGLIAGILLLVARLIWAGVFSILIPPLALLLNVLIKELVGRPRPEETAVHQLLTPIGLSFPSGHAMAPTVFFGFLGLIAWMYLRPGWKRTASVLVFVLLVIVVGLSRIYLGVHWLSDIIGGWTGGLLMLLLADRLYQQLAPNKTAPTEARS